MSYSVKQLTQAGLQFYNAGDLQNANLQYRQALSLAPDDPDVLHMLGLIAYAKKELSRATELIEAAIRLAPSANYYNSIANVYQDMGQADSALSSYRKALDLDTSDAQIHNNIGTLYKLLGQLENARAHFLQAVNIDSSYAMPLFNLGNLALDIADYASALQYYHKSLKLSPHYLDAWLNAGIALHELGLYEQALEPYQRALELQPDNVKALCNMGTALGMLQRDRAALDCYRRSYDIEPQSIEVAINLLKYTSQYLAWDETDELKQVCIQRIPDYVKNASAMPLDLFASLSLSFPLNIHVLAAAHKAKKYESLAARIGSYQHQHTIENSKTLTQPRKLRVGYMSTDFRVHAVGMLIYQLFECHRSDQVEVFVFSWRQSDDQIAAAIKRSADHFIDLHLLSDRVAAEKVYSCNLDILVDMNGFTFGAHPLILALRPVPIQVSFLGFLGTCAAPFHDYIIADRTVFGDDEEQHFSERPVYMPHSFTALSRCPFKLMPVTREQYGLPEDAFVLCTFNTLYKVDRDSFNLWLDILKQTSSNTVLWFYDANEDVVRQRVIDAVKAAGVDPGRIYFAARVGIPEAISRMQCADLFLDSLSYSAGATAAMAYWAQLPILCYQGTRFVSRMGASFARAIKCEELIAHTAVDYLDKAVKLSQDKMQYQAIKQKVIAGQDSSPLFDMARYAMNLEMAYRQMVEQYQQQNQTAIVV